VIAIVDYGMGNLRSVERAFHAVGAPAVVTSEPAALEGAERLVVPGVGAFGDAMRELGTRGLLAPLRRAIDRGKPLLGICLGMQILFERGEEFGAHEGLGVFRGTVVRFSGPGLKVPHLGWNTVRKRRRHPVLALIEEGTHFYFVHSYHVLPADASDVVTETDYGIPPFASSVARGSVFACQFHPEKSQARGLALLAEFARWRP
jgi:glutamine amidotransferase